MDIPYFVATTKAAGAGDIAPWSEVGRAQLSSHPCSPPSPEFSNGIGEYVWASPTGRAKPGSWTVFAHSKRMKRGFPSIIQVSFWYFVIILVGNFLYENRLGGPRPPWPPLATPLAVLVKYETSTSQKLLVQSSRVKSQKTWIESKMFQCISMSVDQRLICLYSL
jgi:hypothetical protein